MASTFLFCYPGCVGGCPQDVTDGTSSSSYLPLTGWNSESKNGLCPYEALSKKAETFRGPPCSPPTRLSLNFTGQNLGTFSNIQESWEGNRISMTSSHSHNTLPGLRVSEPHLRPCLPIRVLWLKKLRKAVAADTNGSDLTTGVLCFYQGLKGHLKYIVNWMTEYILNTYNLTGTGHHNHSWNEKINDIALALKDVFIICLGWREVRRKMFPSTFGM